MREMLALQSEHRAQFGPHQVTCRLVSKSLPVPWKPEEDWCRWEPSSRSPAASVSSPTKRRSNSTYTHFDSICTWRKLLRSFKICSKFSKAYSRIRQRGTRGNRGVASGKVRGLRGDDMKFLCSKKLIWLQWLHNHTTIIPHKATSHKVKGLILFYWYIPLSS